MWTSPSELLECPSLGASDPKEGQSRRHNIFYVLVTAIIHCHIHGILGYTGHHYSVREEATKDMKTRRQWVFFRDNLREWLPQPFWFDCIELDSIAAGEYNFWHLLLICSEVDVCLLFLNHWINTIANFLKMETTVWVIFQSSISSTMFCTQKCPDWCTVSREAVHSQ